jgi:hypothetical protein
MLEANDDTLAPETPQTPGDTIKALECSSTRKEGKTYKSRKLIICSYAR